MQLRRIELIGTTDASGVAAITAAIPVLGVLEAVQMIDGDLADGVDATVSVTSTDSAVDQMLLTLTDFNTDSWFYPRAQVHNNAGAGVHMTARTRFMRASL